MVCGNCGRSASELRPWCSDCMAAYRARISGAGESVIEFEEERLVLGSGSVRRAYRPAPRSARTAAQSLKYEEINQ